METLTSSTNYDEIAMQQSLLFSDSLKDLKNLSKQLYAAAEYFELSYTNDDQKQLVVETLKDYAVKALVNTVDHLGAVSCKVNDLLGEKVNEVSKTELRVSCIQQVLDPIDGTRGFVKGNEVLYVIDLSLVVEGQIVLGVMGCPNWRGDKSNNLTSKVKEYEKVIMVAHVGCGTWSKGLSELQKSNWYRCSVDGYTEVRKERF